MESGWERDVEIHKGWDCVCLVVAVVGVALIVALGVMGGGVGDGGETGMYMYRSGGGGDSVVHRSVGGGMFRSG